MKKMALAAALVALVFARPAHSDSIKGTLAIAGATTYTSTGISFSNPSVTIIATGNFLPLLAQLETVASFNFASAAGFTLFTSVNPPDIAMQFDTLNVVTNNANFLNIIGTATFTEPGFDPTVYDYSLSATRPDGVTSYTLTAAPPALVPEPASLLLLSTGLAAMGLLCRKRMRKA